MFKSRYTFYVLLVSCLMVTGQAQADSMTPSNEELYQMILKLQQDQANLKREAQQAKAEAAAAKAELEKTRGQLEAANARIDKQEQVATAPSGSAVRVPDNDGGFRMALDALFLTPRNDHLSYAISDPSNPVFVSPGSKSIFVDPDSEWGYRLSLGGEVAGTGLDVWGRYTSLNVETNDEVMEPAGGLLWAPLAAPSVGINQADRATAEYDLNYDVFDLEIGQKIAVGNSVNLRLFGGLRYADIDNELNVLYYGGPVGFDPNDPGRVNIPSDFSGFGPRIGVDGSWQFARGWSLMGTAATSLMVGDFDINYEYCQQLQPNGTPCAFPFTETHLKSNLDNQFVPVLEAKLGVGYEWQYRQALLHAQLGYQWENWFDGYGTTDFYDSGYSSVHNTRREDFGLDGAFFRFQADF
jgi:hypothetical protein